MREQLFYVAVLVLPAIALALGLAFLTHEWRLSRRVERPGVMDFTGLTKEAPK